ncbi:MAG TPA: translocation/assembly module TamB domain-containing protein [Caulobacteraceae bacterium]
MTAVELSPEERRLEIRRQRAARRRRRLIWIPFWGGAGLVALVVLLAVGIRVAVLTDTGRTTLVGWLDGMDLGRFGTLQLSGLSGDVFGDFKVKRLAVVDEKGVWLEGRDVTMRWRSYSLLRRRLWAESITAESVHVLRRPVLEEREDKPKRDLPVSIRVDKARFRLITEPAFSVRRGDWSVAAQARVARAGPVWAQLDATSMLRPGDGITTAFRTGNGEFLARADAIEKAGGALAGALGLPAGQPFVLRLRAAGQPDLADLNLITRSGVIAPISAQGRWAKTGGGRLRAAVDLGASSFTRAYVPRVGQRVGVAADILPVEGPTFRMTAAVFAENLRATAAGRVDVAERASPSGLQVRAATNSLTRLVGAPVAGFAELDGELRGGLADWRFEGTTGAQQVAAPNYTLASVSGPVTVARRRGELTLGAELQGRGGAGRGLVAGWLGAAPRAEFEAARLRDGRVLVRSLNAVGAGMRVQGSGGRGLLGDLTFRGEGTLSNLASLRPGASGAVTGTFAASQGGGRRPWAFDLDVRGERLATGMAQLDRLLGARPRLEMAAEYGSGRLAVERAVLAGAAGTVSGAGTVGTNGALDLNLDWRARGPFAAGPIEISGYISGEGELGGTIGSPRADLTARLGVLDLERLVVRDALVALSFVKTPGDFNGFMRVTGGTEYGPARANAGFRFAGNGIDLRDVDLDAGGVQAKGAVSLRNRAPTTADFTFTAGPGAFLSRGTANGVVRIVDGGGGASAAIRLEGRNLALGGADTSYVESISLNANGPLARLPFTVSAAGAAPQPWRFAGDGVYARQRGVQTVSLGGAGRVRQFDLRTLEPVMIRLAPDDRSARLRLAVGGGQVSLDGRQAGETLDARATFAGLNVGALSEDFAGRVDGTAVLQGRGARLTGQLDAALQQARSLDAPANLALNGQLRAVLSDSQIRVVANATNQSGLRANVDAVLPAVASAKPLRLAVNRTRPIGGTFAAEGELRPLWDLFYGGERSLAGYVSARGTLGGTLNDPRPTGRASLRNGQFTDEGTGLALRNLRFDSELGGSRVFVRELTGTDASGGTVSGGGEINLRQTGGSNFQAQLRSFRIIDNELAEADASGTVTVARNAQGQVNIVGRLTIDEAEIRPNPPTPSGVVRMDVIERNAPQRQAATTRRPAGAGRGPPIALDVTLDAPRRVWVRGRGLNVELAVDAAVTGTIRDPNLTGVARVVRGEYAFAGRRFEFDERGTIRLGESASEIRLDLTAVREDPTLTAEIRIRGTAAEPEITLASRPQLPQDEILSQVLFGRSASQLSALEAAQLASALSGLRGGGGFDVIGGLRELAGLDRLSFGQDEASGVTVAGGKYLSDDIYLEIIGGGREGPAVQVEWQLSRRLSIISRLAQGAGDQIRGARRSQGSSVSVRYRRESR